jgi:hypothetical protein
MPTVVQRGRTKEADGNWTTSLRRGGTAITLAAAVAAYSLARTNLTIWSLTFD